MRVLLVNGFGAGARPEVVDAAADVLTAAGHEVTRADLAAEGFDRFMTAEERAAYHSDDPLITPEARAAAGAVTGHTGIVVCYPVEHHTCPPRVKSWQERVFVLGVAFRFKPSGKITGALDHVQRACVIAVGDPSDRLATGRNGYGRSLARSFVLSSNRACRARFLTVAPSRGDDPTGPADLSRFAKVVARW